MIYIRSLGGYGKLVVEFMSLELRNGDRNLGIVRWCRVIWLYKIILVESMDRV